MQNKMNDALVMYTKAMAALPENLTSLVGLARVNYELGKDKEVLVAYNKLKEKSQSISEKYAYLDSTRSSVSRASAAIKSEGALWDEE